MKEYILNYNESGQRFDKYLKKLLPNATTSFIYKMLRKKNITLNGKKATGNEKLNINDKVCLFFSDETFLKFSQDESTLKNEYQNLKKLGDKKLSIVYEDEDVIIIDKPYNMLSQKANANDISANEYILGHLISQNKLSFDTFKTFRPSVCNRLDRNTTGLLIAGKTMKGLQEMSKLIQSRDVKKYYHCIVSGCIQEKAHLKGYLKKDESTNTVIISEEELPDSQYIETSYQPIAGTKDCTLLEVHLITGRTHQIRAHLSSIHHPIIGDMKYGEGAINKKYYEKYQVNHQLLHAYRLEFPDGRTVIAEDPALFHKILDSNSKGI